jgi:FkbM family methyltransferase
MILCRIFEGQNRGFYVDVGAHHPRRFSNTNVFYRRGWRGINIEPNPDAARIFRASRGRDINLQLGVSIRAGSLRFYQFDEPALNTFDEKIVESRLANTPYKLLGTVDVPVERLETVLSKHLPRGQQIDFLSIDVEGLDMAVLQSNDWKLFRPQCVLVEALGIPLENVKDSEVFRFMSGTGYELVSKTFNTLVFRKKGSQRE